MSQTNTNTNTNTNTGPVTSTGAITPEKTDMAEGAAVAGTVAETTQLLDIHLKER